MERLSVQKFGKALLSTNDLDPVYVALVDAEMGEAQRRRLLLAYWCFYHLGSAAYLSTQSGAQYWDTMMVAARNEGLRWPRGAERRHFRGQQAIAAVEALRERFRLPEHVIDHVSSATTFERVAELTQQLRGFGPWIAFKVADMLERVLRVPVDFSTCHLGIYKDPRQGAALVRFGDWQEPISDEELVDTYSRLVRDFRGCSAPPTNDRPVGLQEVETICCKYKSYWKGRYYIGKDIEEIRHGLSEPPQPSRAARLLLEALPPLVKEGTWLG